MSVSDDAMKDAINSLANEPWAKGALDRVGSEHWQKDTEDGVKHYGESIEKMREGSKMRTGPLLRGQDRLPNAAATAGTRAAPSPAISNENVDAVQVGGSHYKNMGIQPWQVMEVVLSREEFIGFLKGCIIKYGMRDGKKQGAHDDADKAEHCKRKLASILKVTKW